MKARNRAVTYLIWHAEDVCVILLEAAHTSQTSQGTVSLITMQDTKVSESDGQVAVRTGSVVKHQAVTRTVHGLECKVLVVYFEVEHVVLVLGPVS